MQKAPQMHHYPDYQPLPHAGGFAPRLAQHQQAIASLVEANNDATLDELCEQLYEYTGVHAPAQVLCAVRCNK